MLNIKLNLKLNIVLALILLGFLFTINKPIYGQQDNIDSLRFSSIVSYLKSDTVFLKKVLNGKDNNVNLCLSNEVIKPEFNFFIGELGESYKYLRDSCANYDTSKQNKNTFSFFDPITYEKNCDLVIFFSRSFNDKIICRIELPGTFSNSFEEIKATLNGFSMALFSFNSENIIEKVYIKRFAR